MQRNQGVGLEGWAICRDEACDRVDLHAPHRVRRQAQPDAAPVSHVDAAAPGGGYVMDGLDESILRAAQVYEVRSYTQIFAAVRDDYGSCGERRVYRRIAKLIQHRHLARIGSRHDNLTAYVRAGSPLLKGPFVLHEQIATAYACLDVGW